MLKLKDNLTDLEVIIEVKSPTLYIINNYQKLLPTWEHCPQNLIIFLFQSTLELKTETDLVEQEKDRLKAQFITIGTTIKNLCSAKIEIICPQLGIPINNHHDVAQINFDIVTVVHQLLALEFKITPHHCKTLYHPQWQTAIYPCLMVTEASKAEIKAILEEFYIFTKDYQLR